MWTLRLKRVCSYVAAYAAYVWLDWVVPRACDRMKLRNDVWHAAIVPILALLMNAINRLRATCYMQLPLPLPLIALLATRPRGLNRTRVWPWDDTKKPLTSACTGQGKWQVASGRQQVPTISCNYVAKTKHFARDNTTLHATLINSISKKESVSMLRLIAINWPIKCRTHTHTYTYT